MTRFENVIGFLVRADGSLQHRALRSGVWVGMSSVGITLLTFGRGVIRTRLLSPEPFGLLAVCLVATLPAYSAQ